METATPVVPANGASPESNFIELKIPASSQWVRVARLTVAGVASRLPFGVDAVEDIKLAVTEAINNAIQHAPLKDQEVASVTIRFEFIPDGLWISVADEGRMPDGMPVRTAHPMDNGELPESGLGLLLIQSLMDEVYHDSGSQADTVVRMFKKVPVQTGAPSHTLPV